MQTGKQTAIFDCKKYNAKLSKEQWRVLGDTENVQCTITYALAELPDMFKQDGQPDEFVRLYASKTEKENAQHENRAAVNNRAAVRFKVGANCKWFDKYGHACERPHNTELDGKRFEVNIDFARKAKQPGNNLAPSGYWANAIMYREIEECPFAGQEFEKDETLDEPEPDAAQAPTAAPAAPAAAPQPQAPTAAPAAQAAAAGEDDGDLPF